VQDPPAFGRVMFRMPLAVEDAPSFGASMLRRSYYSNIALAGLPAIAARPTRRRPLVMIDGGRPGDESRP